MFKKYLLESTIKKIQEQKSKISIFDFVYAVNSYSNLDTALENLPNEYIEFYIKNMNNKALNKELKKRKLIENYDWEVMDRNLGMSPKPDKIKKIQYKGNYIIFKFEPGIGWVPNVSFRSISQATKFIKNLYDEIN